MQLVLEHVELVAGDADGGRAAHGEVDVDGGVLAAVVGEGLPRRQRDALHAPGRGRRRQEQLRRMHQGREYRK